MFRHAMRRAAGAAGGGGPIEYVASAGTRTASSSVTVSKPSGTTSGDLMVAFVMAASSGVTPSYPSGWTQVKLDTTGRNSGAVAYKIAGGSEPSSYTFTVGGSNGRNVQIITIRNGSNLTVGIYEENDEQTLEAPSITATEGILLAWFGSEFTPSLVTPPSGMTQAIETTGGPVCWTYYQTISSGVTGIRTLIISSENDTRSILVGVY